MDNNTIRTENAAADYAWKTAKGWTRAHMVTVPKGDGVAYVRCSARVTPDRMYAAGSMSRCATCEKMQRTDPRVIAEDAPVVPSDERRAEVIAAAMAEDRAAAEVAPEVAEVAAPVAKTRKRRRLELGAPVIVNADTVARLAVGDCITVRTTTTGDGARYQVTEVPTGEQISRRGRKAFAVATVDPQTGAGWIIPPVLYAGATMTVYRRETLVH